jgi:hypothetical protein
LETLRLQRINIPATHLLVGAADPLSELLTIEDALEVYLRIDIVRSAQIHGVFKKHAAGPYKGRPENTGRNDEIAKIKARKNC